MNLISKKNETENRKLQSGWWFVETPCVRRKIRKTEEPNTSLIMKLKT